MIQTSYFAKYKGDNSISIALYKPKWFKGESYLKLAPPSFLLNRYKSGEISEEQYIEIYKGYVLSKLNPQEVYNDLDGKVLLCYERSSDFCHRHIVAEWLSKELNIIVEEIK